MTVERLFRHVRSHVTGFRRFGTAWVLFTRRTTELWAPPAVVGNPPTQSARDLERLFAEQKAASEQALAFGVHSRITDLRDPYLGDP